MDQQTKQTMDALKVEVYDANKTLAEHSRFIMMVCEKLELPTGQGVDVDAVLGKIEELMTNQTAGEGEE